MNGCLIMLLPLAVTAKTVNRTTAVSGGKRYS